MIRLEKPDEVKQVDDLDLVRMTRYETIDRYGVLPMHYRAQVIREQVLTAEVLSDMIRRALEMPEGVRKGRLVWETLLPLVPLQPHGLDVWDVRWAAEVGAVVFEGGAKIRRQRTDRGGRGGGCHKNGTLFFRYNGTVVWLSGLTTGKEWNGQ